MIQQDIDRVHTIKNTYDDRHNKIRSEHSDGLIQYWHYDDKNRIIKYIANCLKYVKEKEYIYDDKNHIVTEKKSNGDINLFYYNEKLQLITTLYSRKRVI